MGWHRRKRENRDSNPMFSSRLRMCARMAEQSDGTKIRISFAPDIPRFRDSMPGSIHLIAEIPRVFVSRMRGIPEPGLNSIIPPGWIKCGKCGLGGCSAAVSHSSSKSIASLS
jgi:hypothetical protein